MSTTEQPLGPGIDSGEGPETSVPYGVSVLEHLQQQKQAIIDQGEREPLTLPVPAWKGALAIRYAFPEAGATPILRAGMRMQSMKPERAIEAALDVIIGAAIEVVGKRPGDDSWQPLEPGGVRIGQRLATALQIEVPREVERVTRYIARVLFSPQAQATGKWEGDLALVNAAGEVTEWLRGIEAGAEDELGE